MSKRAKPHADWLECDVPAVVPVLPLRSTVLYPLHVASVQITAKPNLLLLDEHAGPGEILAAGALMDPERSPSRRNLSTSAVACRVLNRIDMADGSAKVALQGLRRLHLGKITESRPFLKARAECVEEIEHDDAEARDLLDQLIRLLAQLVQTDERYPDELLKIVQLNVESGSRCADLVADRVQFSYADKRHVLETYDVSLRLALVTKLLQREIARAQVAGEVQVKTAALIDREQRQALLRAQLGVIRRELDELDPEEAEIARLERKVHAAGLPAAVAEEALHEVQRLRKAPVRALAGASIRTYVEWVLSLPWRNMTKDRLDLRYARRVLEERYFASEEPRRKLMEFLAVRKLAGTKRASLLGIVGPPGSGRTSLARTIADVLGRKFVCISMRGAHHEEEIRGQRRGDVGARPSIILDALREAGTLNPVVLIDEIDQIEEEDGDPVGAVVDAVDPARNRRFLDPYLGVPFDLSQALFIVTALVDDYLPEALWEELDVIELPGYTEQEKLTIARRNIWPQVVEEHGLLGRNVKITNAAVRAIIRQYTREAGVRDLRIQLGRICRRIAVKVATSGRRPVSIHVRNLRDFLGAPIYTESPLPREPQVGAAMGLAWTESGGDLLPIEALLMPGEGRRTVTGLLGEVMQESVSAAISYVRSRAEQLGIAPDAFEKNDLHVHLPEGAIEKDGPSAGLAIATAIASLLSRRPVRHDVAMTGEISLRGRVLGVGSIREKMLAAYRAGIRNVVLPKANQSDLDEVPHEIRKRMRFHFVAEVADAFAVALHKSRRPLETPRAAKGAKPPRKTGRTGKSKRAETS